VRKELLLFEKSSPGRRGASLPSLSPEEQGRLKLFPKDLRRTLPPPLPELSEPEVVRHFTRLSQWNYSIDTNFYPLGSCTMKYNPKINEEMARLSGWVNSHPYQPEETIQGSLQLLYELEHYLAEITGMDALSLQPAAGAHGELTGILMIRAYHQSRGRPRSKILIPDTAHGTNPASSTMANYQTIQIKSSTEGRLSPRDVAAAMDDEVAALMLTNPNTLGLFETHIKEICDIVHKKGGLVYCDGANLNAIMGKTRVGDIGVDVLHINLHKTFTTPHGGGGPGAGPVGVKAILKPFLPTPLIEKRGEVFSLNYNQPKSIGKVQAFYGNFGILVRAYTYIREMGPEGLKRVSELAVLNANYIRKKLEGTFDIPFGQDILHEVIISDKTLKGTDVKTLDFAKRIIDYGMHPPTIYFPLVVPGAFMIEPTETESIETLDQFCEAMLSIAKEVQETPEIVHKAPHTTRVGRIDEVKAARELRLRYSHDSSNKSINKP